MTDENKNIDAFFSARLQNETIENEGWNMPSDDIWNAAKPKFIDRKKRKRRFLFWLLIPLLALCISIPLKLLEGSEVAENDIEINQKLSSQKEELVGASESIDNKNENSNKRNQENNDNELLDENNIATDVELSKNTIKSKSKSKTISQRKKNDELILEFENRRNQTFTNELLINLGETKEKDAIKIEAEKGSSTKGNTKITPMAAIESKFSIQNQLVPEVNYQSLTPPMIIATHTEPIIPLTRTNYSDEIGISHSQLLLNLILAVGVDSENEVDEFSLKQNYFNANVTRRKWINKNWSLMTGIQYSRLDLNVNFSVFDTLDRELMQFINEEFNDVTSRSTIGDQETDFVIDLKDGVDAELGDILNIRGDFTEKIRAFQIPFFLDYHIYKRKVEYIFGLGVTIEYLTVTESPNEFMIYRESELISKPAVIPEFSDKFIDGSIYIKSGIRYVVSEHFNFGLDAKINLLGLPFSGVDAGIYYRWN